MSRRIALTLWPAVAVAALAAAACNDGRQAEPIDPGTPSFGGAPAPKKPPPGGCEAGRKFTGGGRIDPVQGKITFGFNVHADDFCRTGDPIKGQIQIVHHPTQDKIHSIAITHFSSFKDTEHGGDCADFGGTARVKHGNRDWHEESFSVIACDNGEPGRRDRFGVTVPAHAFSTGPTYLTGGNIQAHKS